MSDAHANRHEPHPDSLAGRVSIFVPSRYGAGDPVARPIQDNQIRLVSGVLASAFGGASREKIAHNTVRIIGTWQSRPSSGTGADGQLVDEVIHRVWAAVTAEQLGDRVLLARMMEEASRLRDALKQQAVVCEWGRELRFTDMAEPGSGAGWSGEHSISDRFDFAQMAWCRTSSAEDMAGVLTLGGWTLPSGTGPARVPGEQFIPLATRAGPPDHTAWRWVSNRQPQRRELLRLGVGDVLVMDRPDNRIRVWLRTTSEIAGPCDLPLVTPLRPARRIALEFVLALLGGAGYDLFDCLSLEGTTPRFYRAVRKQIDRITSLITGVAPDRAASVSQRLVCRMLFLRFVEAKGWMPGHALGERWHGRPGSYYRDILVPLFETLDTPLDRRNVASDGIPSLNGGLFTITGDERAAEVPQDAFDPRASPPGLLDLLSSYRFTLDEGATSDVSVSVNPSMLGRVLESLVPADDRKSRGVHYTPAHVATELAREGIVSQVFQRLADGTVSAVEHAVLAALADGRRRDLTTPQAEAVQKVLRGLRIVDPAVGSGALLVACLEVMVRLHTACEQILGGDLRLGSPRWAHMVRHYVSACLFGVDISPDAVGIAQLRLWLHVAVGEETPAALPDLGYNLRVGDSLASDPIEDRLVEELTIRGGTVRLGLDGLDLALNRATSAHKAFMEAQPGDRAPAFAELEAAEHALRAELGGGAADGSTAPPFAWTLHFPEVFRGPNRGFDLVIANPPYVRWAKIPAGKRDGLRTRYASMRGGNGDLAYAFVERALRGPGTNAAQPTFGDGLAGRAGGIAFILPNFTTVAAAEPLRALLGQGAHITRWVDFGDVQVFPNATNYVGLLFGTAARGRQKTFDTSVVTPEAWEAMEDGRDWSGQLSSSVVAYGATPWVVGKKSRAIAPGTVNLREIVDIKVGIQTSLDAVYLFGSVVGTGGDGIVQATGTGINVLLERAALFPCAKGSGDLQGDRLTGTRHVLWPYHRDGSVLTEAELSEQFPRAWAYLLANRARIGDREGGRYREGAWWRFRRPQGVASAIRPKILVPALMREASAYLDAHGRVICTGSGTGGGGALMLEPLPGIAVNLEALASFLQSPAHWAWVAVYGSPQRDGWRGIDRTRLLASPVPRTILA